MMEEKDETVKPTTNTVVQEAIPKKKSGCGKYVFLGLLIFTLIASLFVWWNYFKVYSDTTREGILIKFGRKGNVFKTNEGVIVQPGVRNMQAGGFPAPNNFYFSVTDKSIIDSLQNNIGKVVKVHYLQYLRVLPWRGENYNPNGKADPNNQSSFNQENGQYIVDKIISISPTQ
jgi:hypothetical protein